MSMMKAILNDSIYTRVEVNQSTSSFGRWVVKTSPTTFRFFWKKKMADEFADKHNAAMSEAEEELCK